MGEFFRGWKRKLGMATLLVACVFLSLWIRSRIVLDFLEIPLWGHSTFIMLMHHQGFVVLSEYDPEIKVSPASRRWVSRAKSQFSAQELALFNLDNFCSELKYRNHPPAIPTGPSQPISVPVLSPAYQMRALPLPYWLTIPLAVASAILLLSKPPQSLRHVAR